MKSVSTRRPSPSMVVAFIALLIALGATAVAATHRVNGDKLIKQSSLSGNRLRNDTVSGKQVNESSLGKVPSATNADHAGNADALGGVAAAQFDRPGAVLQSGQTEHGVFAGGGGANDEIMIQVQFDPLLPTDVDIAHVIRVTGSSTPQCPGTGQAAPGYLCWYEKSTSVVTFQNFGDPVNSTAGANREGMYVSYGGTASYAYAYGDWAFTAP